MTTTLKYIGVEETYFEIVATGAPVVWRKGSTREVPDANVSALMGTGFFQRVSGFSLSSIFDALGNLFGFQSPNGALVPICFVLPGGQSAIPVILVPNGTVATNGTITLGTALPAINANAWVYLPAGAVVGGLAGLYYATFSSTTVGVITTTFNAASSAFTPYIPSVTAVATGSNSAYTQTTASDITLANVNIPAGVMGPNGALRVHGTYACNNTAGNKTAKFLLNAVAGAVGSSSVMTTTTGGAVLGVIRNRGSLASQVGGTGINSTASAPNYTTVDTSTDKPLTFTAQLATATDYAVLEGFTVEVLPRA